MIHASHVEKFSWKRPVKNLGPRIYLKGFGTTKAVYASLLKLKKMVPHPVPILGFDGLHSYHRLCVGGGDRVGQPHRQGRQGLCWDMAKAEVFPAILVMACLAICVFHSWQACRTVGQFGPIFLCYLVLVVLNWPNLFRSLLFALAFWQPSPLEGIFHGQDATKPNKRYFKAIKV